jgi:hypothetical protein
MLSAYNSAKAAISDFYILCPPSSEQRELVLDNLTKATSLGRGRQHAVGEVQTVLQAVFDSWKQQQQQQPSKSPVRS